jgi:hypothetical protein
MTWLTVMRYVCHTWPMICSTCRNYNAVLFLFMTYQQVCPWFSSFLVISKPHQWNHDRKHKLWYTGPTERYTPDVGVTGMIYVVQKLLRESYSTPSEASRVFPSELSFFNRKTSEVLGTHQFQATVTMWFLNIWDNVPMDLKYVCQQYFTYKCFLGFIRYNKIFITYGYRKYENLFTHEYHIPARLPRGWNIIFISPNMVLSCVITCSDFYPLSN